MDLLSIFAHVVAASLLVLPIRGHWAYRQLLRDLEANVPGVRARFYVRAILRKSVQAAGCVIWLALAPRTYPFEFRWANATTTLMWIGYAVLLTAISVVYFRRRATIQLRLLKRMAGGLIPTDANERRLWWVVSLAAGVCEEVAYRWFLCSYLSACWGIGFVPSFAISSFVFGLAHIYQGPLGVGLTALTGALFAYSWWDSGSLWFPIAFHTLIDLRVAWIATPERLAAVTEPSSR
jgi:membrane protease YdiL (CAAX protease family)